MGPPISPETLAPGVIEDMLDEGGRLHELPCVEPKQRSGSLLARSVCFACPRSVNADGARQGFFYTSVVVIALRGLTSTLPARTDERLISDRHSKKRWLFVFRGVSRCGEFSLVTFGGGCRLLRFSLVDPDWP